MRVLSVKIDGIKCTMIISDTDILFVCDVYDLICYVKRKENRYVCHISDYFSEERCERIFKMIINELSKTLRLHDENMFSYKTFAYYSSKLKIDVKKIHG